MAVQLEKQDVPEELEEGEPRHSPEKRESEEGEKSSRKTAYLNYLGLVVVVIGFASCMMQLQFHGTLYSQWAWTNMLKYAIILADLNRWRLFSGYQWWCLDWWTLALVSLHYALFPTSVCTQLTTVCLKNFKSANLICYSQQCPRPLLLLRTHFDAHYIAFQLEAAVVGGVCISAGIVSVSSD